MPLARSHRYIVVLTAIVLTFSVLTVQTQEKARRPAPDVSVAGLKLGDRVSGKAFLSLYQPQTEEDGLPRYYFYNGQGTTVMKITAASIEDPYFVTEIEVFKVGESYQKRHFFLKDIGHFVTESGIFIGFRQKAGNMALAMIVGVPNVGRSNIIGPKDVIKRKGEPDDRVVNDKEETFDYKLESLTVADSNYRYSANYRFYDRKLKQFVLKLKPQAKPEIAKAKQ